MIYELLASTLQNMSGNLFILVRPNYISLRPILYRHTKYCPKFFDTHTQSFCMFSNLVIYQVIRNHLGNLDDLWLDEMRHKQSFYF